MKKELEDALVRDFPQLYDNEQFKADGRFRVGDGWERIIRRMSEHLILSAPPTPISAISCLKSKFAELRVYFVDPNVVLNYGARAALSVAMADCCLACERCGLYGEQRVDKDQFVYRACESCHLGLQKGKIARKDFF